MTEKATSTADSDAFHYQEKDSDENANQEITDTIHLIDVDLRPVDIAKIDSLYNDKLEKEKKKYHKTNHNDKKETLPMGSSTKTKTKHGCCLSTCTDD
jgi:hypothetical protein